MAEEKKGNESSSSSIMDDLVKVGVYIQAKRASDNVNDKTDKNGAGKGLGRFYPKLDGNNTIGELRAAAALHFYTKGENYNFYDKKSKTIVKNDNTLIKDVAVITDVDAKEDDDEKKDDSDAKSHKINITIHADKVYANETPGETQDAANELVEQVVELDTKAFYAVGSLDGCDIVLTNILKLLSTVFADVNKDPLLQTLVTIAKHDKTADKETIKQNKIAMKQLLLEMGAYKKSEIEKVQQILGLVLAGLTVTEGLKWGMKKVHKRVTRNRKVYEGPQTKWKSRFNKAKSWGKKGFKAGMKFAKAAMDVAAIGLTIYGIAAEAQMKKDHWREVCTQLIEQKKKRYDDYEDIYSRYNDLSDTIWMLRNQFVTNFEQQCTKELLNGFGKVAPTITSMSGDGDTVLKSLIGEVMNSLTNIQEYLYGLVKEYTQLSTSMKFIKKYQGGNATVKSVKGYDAFIESVEDDEDNPQKLNDKQKARFVDIYVLYLLHKYFEVLDESGLNNILDYDKKLRGIISTFPQNDDSMFGEKDAPLKEYIQQMRMTYLWFDGANRNSSSTGGGGKAVVTFAFAQKVQELYDNNK